MMGTGHDLNKVGNYIADPCGGESGNLSWFGCEYLFIYSAL